MPKSYTEMFNLMPEYPAECLEVVLHCREFEIELALWAAVAKKEVVRVYFTDDLKFIRTMNFSVCCEVGLWSGMRTSSHSKLLSQKLLNSGLWIKAFDKTASLQRLITGSLLVHKGGDKNLDHLSARFAYLLFIKK